MDLGLGNTLLAGDPRLVDHIVGEVKSQGIFDQFRKDCIADVDTKPAYQNLRTRVESSVNSFLNKQTWKADLNKNQLRETLRKQIHDAPYLDAGVERIVDQVVNPKVYSVFMPQIEDVVYKFLGLERPKNQQRNGPCGFKDLLPKDLDPVSPESDKNSLRDISLDSVDANIVDTSAVEKEITSIEKNRKEEIENEKDQARNGQHSNEEEKLLDEISKPLSNLPAGAVFDNLAKMEEKIEEEEEDSPTFEPIDIMNLNESNISNDSHLSGISELTSHRSQSPELSNETSRDNMDFSNHDSQFSKVSSDSRLSIVTDFGSSNHEASTPLSDIIKEDSNKDKNDGKFISDNFKAVREYEIGKVNKDGKSSYEISQIKETTSTDSRSIRQSVSSKETSRDGMENTIKDLRDSKDKTRDGESIRSKTTKEREAKDRETKDRETKDRESKDREPKDRESKDPKREKEIRRKSNNHSSDTRNDKVSKTRIKEKSESSRESGEKMKEKDVSGSRPKDERIKETEKKEMIKESKDLKDIYKEKIRELREKKELTEKEKLSKDKDTKLYKETKEKRDSSRDKRDSRDHKGSSSSRSHNSSRSESKTGKSGEKEKEAKGARSESRDKGKKDERRYSKDHRSKRNSAGQSESGDKNDGKKLSRSEKDDKNEKSDVKQDSKQKSISKRDSRVDTISNKNSDSKRESSKSEIDTKDKKRRDEKKNKIKDDHSSLRKNSDDRRSTDRDGSNGSNGKSSQKNNSSSGATSTKPTTTNLSKESTTTSNSSSETSDSIEEKQNEKLGISFEQNDLQINEVDHSHEDEIHVESLDIGQNEISLPIKKRPLSMENEVILKKPKFAKNFQEAKKLMKIRRRMERESMKKQVDNESSNESCTNEQISVPIIIKNEVESVPDDERVQIVEFRDEEYDEPYPEVKSDFTVEERSQIILGGEPIFTSNVAADQFKAKSTLSVMEIAIRESLNEMISDKKIEETNETPKNMQHFFDSEMEIKVNCHNENSSLSSTGKKVLSMDEDNLKDLQKRNKGNLENLGTNNEGKSENFRKNIETSSIEWKVSSPSPARIEKTDMKCVEGENGTKDDEIAIKVEQGIVKSSENVEIVELSKVPKSDKKLKEEIFDEDEKTIFLSKESTVSPDIEENRVQTKIEEIAPTILTETEIKKEMEEEAETNEEIILKKESCDITRIESNKIVSLNEDDMDFSDEESPCLYFIKNNERLEKFTKFMKSLEIEESSIVDNSQEMSNDEVVSSISKTMAPPKPKRKYSISPLTDILLNNANNNNEAHKIIPSDSEDNPSNMKKRKIGRPKKQQGIINASLCGQQNLSNGENFVMPLSPESDVSATSEKTPSNPLKDEKSRPRGSNQRYTSDDLYKPRPLFSSSSRRSRRSNQT